MTLFNFHLGRFLAWSLAIFPLFFPLYLWKVNLVWGGFVVPFTVLELLTYFLFLPFLWLEIEEWRREGGIFGRLFFALKNCWRLGRGKWRERIFLPPVLLMAAAVSGLIFAPDLRLALGVFKGWLLAPLLYFVMISARLDDSRWLRITLHAYFLSAAVLACWALNQVVSGEYLTVDARASGPFKSANYLAMYLGPAAAVLAVLMFKKIAERKRGCGWEFLLLAAELVAIVAALYFAQSYAALIAVVAAGGVYLLLRYDRKTLWAFRGRLAGGLAVAVAVLAIALYLGQGQTYKFQDFLAFDRRSSSSVRLEIWTISWAFIRENPLLGIGLGQFQPAYEQRAAAILGRPPLDPQVPHPHNIWAAFWLNTGLLGLLAFCWLTAAAYFRPRFSPPYLRPYVHLGLVMITVILFHGVFDTTFWKNDLAYLFWLSLFLARV